MAAFISLTLEHQEEMVVRVTGWSMGCALGPASSVVLTALSRTPKLGEIIVVKTDSELMAHRVIAVTAAEVVTKGDNCINADPPVTESQILGKVQCIDRNGVRKIPWHWKHPVAGIIALLSRWEAQGPELLKKTLIRLHRFWQLRIMWRFMDVEDQTQGRW